MLPQKIWMAAKNSALSSQKYITIKINDTYVNIRLDYHTLVWGPILTIN